MNVDVEIEWVATSTLPSPSVWEKIGAFFRDERLDELEFEPDDPWMLARVVYAYLDSDDSEIVYIGKAWSTNVFDRFVASDKDKLWMRLEEEYDLRQPETDVIVGIPDVPKGSRLTRQLLADLESLLIYHLEPCGNRQSASSRLARDGMVVRCVGEWPLKRKTFIDE